MFGLSTYLDYNEGKALANQCLQEWMDLLLPVLASAFVGGIIGYSTNWLAIKMLFRPLTEKYIGPFRVPFTPGVMPKKRAALARSLGSTVADYLVTTDTLVAALEHPEFTESLEHFLHGAWSKLAQSEQPLQQLLQTTGLESQIESLPDHLAERLLFLLSDDLWLSQFVTELRSTLRQEWDGQHPKLEHDYFTEVVTAVLTSERVQARFVAELQRFVDDLRSNETALLGDVLPLALQEQLHNLILTDSPIWLDWLQRKLQTPASRALIMSLIQQFLAGSTMLKLMAAFADTSKLADSLIEALAKEEVRTQITNMLLNGWRQLLIRPVSQLAAGVKVAQLSQSGSTFAALALQPSSMATIKGILWRSIQPEAGQLAGDPALTLQLESLAQGALKQLLQAPATRQTLTSLLHDLLASLLEATPKSLLANLEPLPSAAVAPRLQQWLLRTAATFGPELLSALRLPEIVEAQVNALDMVQVEDILLQVMREQLAAITNLGFLLGAVIGTIMPFINKLLGS